MMEKKDSTSGQMERRRFLQQTATVAFASPVIVSMMARGAAAQTIVCGEKSGGVGSVDCTITTPCGTGLECRGAPAGSVGDPCGCFVL